MISVSCYWLFGLFTVALAVLFSALSKSNTGVLAGTGGAVGVLYLIGFVPKAKEYMPTLLTDGNSLIYGSAEPKTYTAAIFITAALCVFCFAVSIPVFNKKQL